jgi:protein O-mannosyl-transferase
MSKKQKKPISTPPTPSQSFVNIETTYSINTSPSPTWLPLALMGILGVVVVGVYQVAFKNDFVHWDDNIYVYQNPIIQQAGFGQLGKIFSTSVALNYHPITMLTLMLNALMFGKGATSFIVTNVLIHLINTLLVFVLAQKLIQTAQYKVAGEWIAFFTALLFAVHPMRVESVAWISERKDVLYTAFFLWACLSYLKYLDTGIKKYLTLTFVLFVLSCLSKAQGVVLPLVLLLLDYWHGKNILDKKAIIEKIPFFVFAFVIGVITLSVQSRHDFFGLITPAVETGKAVDVEGFKLVERIKMGSYGFVEYIHKLFVPLNLSPLYPFLNNGDGSIPPEYFAGLVLSPIILIITWLSARKTKLLVLGIGFYFITILLVLQFISVGVAVIADRYTYLPYFGLFFLLCSLLFEYVASTNLLKYGVAIGLIVFASWCVYLTTQQIKVWKNTEALYSQRIKLYPNDQRAYEVRAWYYNEHEQVDLAAQDFEKAISLGVQMPEVYERLGVIVGNKGQKERAMQLFNKAIEIKPDFGSAYINRGIAQFPQAIAIPDFEKAIALAPERKTELKGYLAVCYANTGNIQKGLSLMNEVIDKEGSKSAMDYFNRALMHQQTGNKIAMNADLRKTLEIQPNHPQARQMLR